jgi:carboxylesterase type B
MRAKAQRPSGHGLDSRSGLIAGEVNDYNASKLLTQGDVIVVTFNYRLGAFGFFAQPAIDGEHRNEQSAL